jgi:hypothetical protein
MPVSPCPFLSFLDVCGVGLPLCRIIATALDLIRFRIQMKGTRKYQKRYKKQTRKRRGGQPRDFTSVPPSGLPKPVAMKPLPEFTNVPRSDVPKLPTLSPGHSNTVRNNTFKPIKK